MKVPSTIFKIRMGPDWFHETSDGYFTGRRCLVVSLPGAFTPIWSEMQLPGLEALYDDFKAKGIDDVYCLSVNDSFVMNAWFKDQNINKIKPIGDGEGKFTKGMGMLVNKPKQGFGARSWRYSALIDNCKVIKIFVEDGKNNESNDDDPFLVSDVDTMLNYLKK